MQIVLITLLRVFIGWHFLYEGILKILNPHWSSYSYLMDSKGIFASYFHSLAQQENWLIWIDLTNKWLLAIIGFMLMLGCFTRFFAILGGCLLLVYYASHPAFPGVDYAVHTVGNYLWINNLLIEAISLFLLSSFPKKYNWGLDLMFRKKEYIKLW